MHPSSRRSARAGAGTTPWRLAAMAVVLLSTGMTSASALTQPDLSDAPLPEPAVLEPADGAPCDPETVQEAMHWDATHPPAVRDRCERLHFTHGPVVVKPGQNDALLVPITIEKPAYDGWVKRFKPDLVWLDEESGTFEPPPVHQIHLHHAVWVEAPFQASSLDYSNLDPFFAAGEEKTIGVFDHPYAFPVDDTDTWLMLYMVHNYTSTTRTVWLTWDVDYVKKADGEAAGLKPLRPVWLDVEQQPVDPDDPEEVATPANPVFNVHTGSGHTETLPNGTAKTVCSFPRENCARFNPYGRVTAQQGRPFATEGADRPVTADVAGTIVWMGGHLHPGGVRDDVSLVRPGHSPRRIFASEAIGWQRGAGGSHLGGGPTDSWDFSMTVTGAQYGYGIEIRQGDTLRLNASYESDVSWYENMGIVVAFVAPGDTSGLDPFSLDPAEIRDEAPVSAPIPEGAHYPAVCQADSDTLCLRGAPTHGHLDENRVFGGPTPGEIPDAVGDDTSVIPVGAFSFGPADMGVISGLGHIPQVRRGDTVTFLNADTAADVWHTVTRCQEPCTGGTGLAFPKADGGSGPDDEMDFDSSEIGYGLFFSPAKAHVDEALSRFATGILNQDYGALSRLASDVGDGVLWEFMVPDDAPPGDYTFFCRIHNSMRGAIRVAE